MTVIIYTTIKTPWLSSPFAWVCKYQEEFFAECEIVQHTTNIEVTQTTYTNYLMCHSPHLQSRPTPASQRLLVFSHSIWPSFQHRIQHLWRNKSQVMKRGGRLTRRDALCDVPYRGVPLARPCQGEEAKPWKWIWKISAMSVTPSHAFRYNMDLEGIDPPKQSAKFKHPECLVVRNDSPLSERLNVACDVLINAASCLGKVNLSQNGPLIHCALSQTEPVQTAQATWCSRVNQMNGWMGRGWGWRQCGAAAGIHRSVAYTSYWSRLSPRPQHLSTPACKGTAAYAPFPLR